MAKAGVFQESDGRWDILGLTPLFPLSPEERLCHPGPGAHLLFRWDVWLESILLSRAPGSPLQYHSSSYSLEKGPLVRCAGSSGINGWAEGGKTKSWGTVFSWEHTDDVQLLFSES